MKRLNMIAKVFFIALAAVSLSCSSDDDNGGGGGGSTTPGTIKAKAGSKNFKSMEMATFATKHAVGDGFNIIIQGSNADGTAIQLILNGVDGQPGTWDISDTNGIMAIASYTEIELNMSNPAASTSTTWAAPYDDSGNVGKITISEITDTTVKGSFNFTGRIQEDGGGTKSITNGAFNVDFQ